MVHLTKEQREILRELSHQLYVLRNPSAPKCVLIDDDYAYIMNRAKPDMPAYNVPYVTSPRWDRDHAALMALIIEQRISMRISSSNGTTFVTARSQRYAAGARIDSALTDKGNLTFTYAHAALQCCIGFQRAMGVPETNKDFKG